MGIPGLMQDLLPYAEEITLGSLTGECALPNIRKVVIDGPSLVYHVYYRLDARRHSFGVGIDVQPSYTEINRGVVEFLMTLTSRQIEIQAIYFDGALPVDKRKTRLDRLENGRRSLEYYRKQEIGPFQRSYSARTPMTASWLQSSIWEKTVLASKYSRLPPPPFMVASVLEHLRDTCESRYSTEMVPGEADMYCAIIARKTGAAILSSDSDMAMYDLDPEGCLVLLDSLDLVSDSGSHLEHNDDNEMLRGRRIHPANIARRLRLTSLSGKPSLSRHGFERLRDPSAPAGTIRSRCTSSHSPGAAEAFQQFCESYQQSGEIDSTQDAVKTAIQLDPRLSELYCQYKYEVYMVQPQQNPHVYLPLLLEDPSRDSSWTYGRDLRILCYSLLKFSAGNTTNIEHLNYVVEFQKRGPRIAGMPLKLLNRSELIPLMDTIIEDLTKHISGGDTLTQWRVFALKAVNEEKVRNGKVTVPSAWAAEFLQRGYVDDELSWADIHIYANMQAVLYSLWILRQACALPQPRHKDLQTAVEDLGQVLESLGPLNCLMASRWEIADAPCDGSGAMTPEASGPGPELQGTGPEQPEMDDSTAPRLDSRTSQKRAKSSQSTPRGSRRRANGNIFELLPSS